MQYTSLLLPFVFVASYSTADCHMHQPQQQQQQQQPQLLSAVGSSITSPTLTTSEQSFQHFNDFISALQSCRESATSLPALTGQQNFIRVGSWPKSEYEVNVFFVHRQLVSFVFLRTSDLFQL